MLMQSALGLSPKRDICYGYSPPFCAGAGDMRSIKTAGIHASGLLLGVSALTGCGGDVSDSEKAEITHSGQHCVIGGFNQSFVDEVKKQLRDPGSFEHAETRIDPVGPDGKHRIAMHFRSRNGFGGMNDMYALGEADHGTCAVSVTAVE
jgi:hypothetical protein